MKGWTQMNADERRRTQMKRGVERSFFRFNTEFRGADSVARHASFVIAGSCRLQVPQTKGYADTPDATNASDRLRAVERLRAQRAGTMRCQQHTGRAAEPGGARGRRQRSSSGLVPSGG